MRLIIKSYLKTFTKNLTTLFGTLIFVFMLTAIVIGMLATPLQISAKAKNYASKNTSFDYYLKNESLSDDFIFNYIFKNDFEKYIKINENNSENLIIDKSLMQDIAITLNYDNGSGNSQGLNNFYLIPSFLIHDDNSSITPEELNEFSIESWLQNRELNVHPDQIKEQNLVNSWDTISGIENLVSMKSWEKWFEDGAAFNYYSNPQGWKVDENSKSNSPFDTIIKDEKQSNSSGKTEGPYLKFESNKFIDLGLYDYGSSNVPENGITFNNLFFGDDSNESNTIFTKQFYDTLFSLISSEIFNYGYNGELGNYNSLNNRDELKNENEKYVIPSLFETIRTQICSIIKETFNGFNSSYVSMNSMAIKNINGDFKKVYSSFDESNQNSYQNDYLINTILYYSGKNMITNFSNEIENEISKSNNEEDLTSNIYKVINSYIEYIENNNLFDILNQLNEQSKQNIKDQFIEEIENVERENNINLSNIIKYINDYLFLSNSLKNDNTFSFENESNQNEFEPDVNDQDTVANSETLSIITNQLMSTNLRNELTKSFTDGNNKESYNNNVLTLIYERIISHNLTDFNYLNEKHIVLSVTKTGSVAPSQTMELFSSDNADFANVILDSGRIATNDDEIVISSAYAKMNDIKIGDTISIPTKLSSATSIPSNFVSDINILTNNLSLKVVGIGLKYENITPSKYYRSSVQDFDTYGIGYVSSSLLSKISNLAWSFNLTGFDANNVQIKIKSLSNKKINDLFYANKTETIYPAESQKTFSDFSSSTTAQNLVMIKIQVIVYIVLGIVVLSLAFVFINFIIKKEINETRRQLGIFKSFGYKVSELSWIFALKTWITISIGIILGYCLSIPLQIYAASNFEKSVTFSFDSIYLSPIFLTAILIVIPLIIMFVSYLLTIRYLMESSLSLINNSSKLPKRIKKQGLIVKTLSKYGKGFGYRLQTSFVSRSKGKFIMVQILFAFSSLVFTLMLGAESIMNQTIKQGYSLLKASANHLISYNSKNDYTFDDTIADERNGWQYNTISQKDSISPWIYYKDYSNYSSVNEAMNDNENNSNSQSTSPSRYEIKLLMNYITNKYNDMNEKDKINYLSLGNITGDNFKYTFLYDLLTIKINNSNKLLNAINYMKQNNIVDADKQFSLYVESDDSRISISSITDIASITNDDFSATLFGIQSGEGDWNKYTSNNFFLSDISRIMSLILASAYLQQLEEIAQQNNVDFTGFDDVLKLFNPNNDKYWDMTDNPLINISSIISNTTSNEEKIQIATNLVLGKVNNALSNISSGFNVSDLSSVAQSLVVGSMMIKHKDNINDEQIVDMNKIWFNSKDEFLTKSFETIMDSDKYKDKKTTELELDTIDMKYGEYGDPRTVLNFDNVSDKQFDSLKVENSDGSINGIVPYSVAKTLNLKIGDKLYLTSSTSSLKPIVIMVAAINKSITFTALTKSAPIFIDYSLYVEKMFSKNTLNQIYQIYNDETLDLSIASNLEKAAKCLVENMPSFDQLYSNLPFMTGKIDLQNISKSISSLKLDANILTMNINNESSMFYSMFGNVITGGLSSSFIPAISDLTASMVTNPSLVSTGSKKSANSAVHQTIPFNIALATINDLANKVTMILTLFLILQTFLLTIILIVIMNIIVDEAAQVILTMRALGYKSKEINWIVMGKYIIGAFISFAVAYAFSLLVWSMILKIVALKEEIYIFMPIEWQTPVITILTLGFVLALGWYTSYKQVNRRKLTQITNFA